MGSISKNRRIYFRSAARCLKIHFLLVFALAGTAQGLTAPDYLLQKGLGQTKGAIGIANLFLGIPYRQDGALDDQGRFTIMAHQDKIQPSPGLNCSGFVLALARYLLDRNFTIDQACQDQRGDSGITSPWGKNWDFGWDLIMNLSQGHQRQLITPQGDSKPDWNNIDGRSLRGFNLQDQAAWEKVFSLLDPDFVYLSSISKPHGLHGVLHYHVGLLLKDSKGNVWLYHTTRASGRAYRINLKDPGGFKRFQKAFDYQKGREKKILIIGLPLAEQLRAAY